ncbi:MAG: hypothetical protein ACLT16_19050 [[Clostridium] innocuum]
MNSSKTYHVSYATIRKVLKQLNDIGLAKTYNGLGTRIQLHNRTAQACVKDSTMIRDALQFMGAIQFITMTIARCSLNTRTADRTRSYYGGAVTTAAL